MSMQAAANVTLEAALAEAEEHYVAANPKSLAHHTKARATMPGGNTRTVLHYSPFPLAIARGEGARLWDIDGHEYTDFLGEYSAGLYGHSNPTIVAAVSEALAQGIVLCAPNQYETELAQAVCARFPNIELVRFCNSGTEANLMALSTARAVTGREGIMVFDGAYHGGVFVYGHGGSPINAPFPTVVAPFNDAERTLALIEEHGEGLAAVIVEPMMGAGGCLPAEPDFMRALRQATERHGIVLIFDEVMTSRLAPGGAQQTLGIAPDMTTLGKYIGGGLSFGAFGGRADIMARFDPARADAFPHAGTFNNNVLTMNAGLAGLTEVFTPEACEALNASGERLRGRLNDLAERHGLPLQVTGVGSLLGIHFNPGPVRTPEDCERDDGDAHALFHLDMLARGQYLARRGYMALMLPLTEADHDGLIAAVDEFLTVRAPVLGV
jgi:glutamate-1-semialdehyde 2,1-aminomutase